MEEIWITLALRIAVTAAIVIAAALAAERAGSLWGGLIATLPVSAGPAFVMLAMEQDSAFIAQAALGGIAANPATVAFGVIVVRVLPVAGVWVALSLALLAWFGVVAASVAPRKTSRRVASPNGTMMLGLEFGLSLFTLLLLFRHLELTSQNA